MHKVSIVGGYFFNTWAVGRANAAGELCKWRLFGYFFSPAQIIQTNPLMHAAPALESPNPNPTSLEGAVPYR